MMGWTHRRKNRSRDPYLKRSIFAGKEEGTVNLGGATFIDQDQKFVWLKWDEVTELD